MELEFLALECSGAFAEPEVIWWCFCREGEVERMGYTTVRYLMHSILSKWYILECTQQTLVSGIYGYSNARIVVTVHGVWVVGFVCSMLQSSLMHTFE